MSILIKGVDIPKNCRQCDFTHGTRFGEILCTFLNEATSIKHKLPNCPLVEVPTPHDRLIDEAQAQKNIEDFIRGWCQDTKNDFNKYRDFVGVFIGLIKQAPTIIEAEE